MTPTETKYRRMGFEPVDYGGILDTHGRVHYPRKAKSPLKAARFFCAECMGMDRLQRKAPFPYDDIQQCTDPMCPLFDFRLGKNPFMKRVLTEDQRKAAQERAALVFGHEKKSTGKDENQREGLKA